MAEPKKEGTLSRSEQCPHCHRIISVRVLTATERIILIDPLVEIKRLEKIVRIMAGALADQDILINSVSKEEYPQLMELLNRIDPDGCWE